MRLVSRFLFMMAPMLFLAGLPGIGSALICIGPEDCNFPSPEPRKLRIVVPDLVLIAESPDRNSTVIPEYLSNNLTLTGIVEVLDKRASLEKNLRAGVDEGTEPDYDAWRKIGADFLVKGVVKGSDSELTWELRLFDVALGKQMLGKRYIGNPDEAGKFANQFTNAVFEAITGTPEVFGSGIIFVSGSPGEKQIFMTTLGGDEVVQITGSKDQHNTQPTIGPGGSMAWVSRKGKIWELVRDGLVVSSGDMHLSPAFKPDGTLAAAKYSPGETAIYDFSTDPPKLMIDVGGINVSPTFSPDGSRMAFVSDKEGMASIYVTKASGGGEVARLTSGAKATDPVWSPSGEFIAYVTRETDICLVRPDGTGFRQLTGGQGLNMRPSFSPDSRMIVFSSTRNGRPQLFVMSVYGDNQRPLMPDYPEPQEQPYWSPVWPEALPDKK